MRLLFPQLYKEMRKKEDAFDFGMIFGFLYRIALYFVVYKRIAK